MDGDVNTAIRYAKHAAQHGADGIVSLPPGVDNGKPQKKLSEQEYLDYYKTLGAATDLPIMVQSHGDMNVDLIVKLYKEVPTLKGVKDETGDVLARLPDFRKQTDGKFVVFNADGANLMLNGMTLGFDGYIPKTGLADISQAALDLWNAGKHKEAFDMFGRVQAFQTIPGVMQYVLTARGVFKETTTIRDAHRIFGVNASRQVRLKENRIREALKEFLGPYSTVHSSSAELETHSRRLLARLVENLPKGIAYDQILPRLQSQRQNPQMIRTRSPLPARPIAPLSRQNPARIRAGRNINPRRALAQLLVALSHRQAKLLLVPRNRQGREAVLLLRRRSSDSCLDSRHRLH